ncbi:hypothetical protein GW17_00009767 [Ensete ventricosum]|nr:hypothetical protein GW17_00009767 [Ensete ventricosum]
MSRAHDGQPPFFPFGNPLRIMFPKGSYPSVETRKLLFSFEQSLAENLKKLGPKDASDVFTLSWMKLAIEFLSHTHDSIKTLMNELRLPVSDWDEKWINIYLDSSVKLLDICIALSSELSRLDRGQLLLKYVLHLVDISTACPSSEELAKAHLYLHEWIEHINSRSPKLENCPAIVVSLQGTLGFPKVKSSKGKALMRALYGFRVMTVFIFGIFSTATLSGCSKPPSIDVRAVRASDGFLWFEAFCDLQAVVNGEFKRQFGSGKVAAVFKEIETVKLCASRLYDLTKDNNGINLEDGSIITPGKGSDLRRQWLRDCVADLAVGVRTLGHELDSLSKQADHFFQIILLGRDALLCNLRMSVVTQNSSMNAFKS